MPLNWQHARHTETVEGGFDVERSLTQACILIHLHCATARAIPYTYAEAGPVGLGGGGGPPCAAVSGLLRQQTAQTMTHAHIETSTTMTSTTTSPSANSFDKISPEYASFPSSPLPGGGGGSLPDAGEDDTALTGPVLDTPNVCKLTALLKASVSVVIVMPSPPLVG